jgi:MSHA biogenesis protein MshP
MTRQPPRPNGFAAIAAIFLVVVLAALGGFMVTFSNSQQITSVQDLQGSRAYWAARAGLEWGISRSGALGGCPLTPNPSTPTSLTIDGWTVEVKCQLNAYTEAGQTRNVFIFDSLAKSQTASVGSVSYTERSVSASMER